MPKKDQRIDRYIERAQPFARPILKHLRQIVHRGCPDVEETVKWRMPFFQRNGIICFMAAFKEHASFGFWQGKVLFGKEDRGGMGHFGRITSIKDLPPDKKLIGYVKKAAELNEQGVKKMRPARGAQKLTVPADLKSALMRNAKARKTFENFSYSHKKEYAQWITEAKRKETRDRRLKSAIEWLSEGKPQNWRYL